MTSTPATDTTTTSCIVATSELLGLDIRPEWMPNVIRFYVLARDMAALVMESGALTDDEAAPVFAPRDGE